MYPNQKHIHGSELFRIAEKYGIFFFFFCFDYGAFVPSKLIRFTLVFFFSPTLGVIYNKILGKVSRENNFICDTITIFVTRSHSHVVTLYFRTYVWEQFSRDNNNVSFSVDNIQLEMWYFVLFLKYSILWNFDTNRISISSELFVLPRATFHIKTSTSVTLSTCRETFE